MFERMVTGLQRCRDDALQATSHLRSPDSQVGEEEYIRDYGEEFSRRVPQFAPGLPEDCLSRFGDIDAFLAAASNPDISYGDFTPFAQELALNNIACPICRNVMALKYVRIAACWHVAHVACLPYFVAAAGMSSDFSCSTCLAEFAAVVGKEAVAEPPADFLMSLPPGQRGVSYPDIPISADGTYRYRRQDEASWALTDAVTKAIKRDDISTMEDFSKTISEVFWGPRITRAGEAEPLTSPYLTQLANEAWHYPDQPDHLAAVIKNTIPLVFAMDHTEHEERAPESENSRGKRDAVIPIPKFGNFPSPAYSAFNDEFVAVFDRVRSGRSFVRGDVEGVLHNAFTQANLLDLGRDVNQYIQIGLLARLLRSNPDGVEQMSECLAASSNAVYSEHGEYRDTGDWEPGVENLNLINQNSVKDYDDLKEKALGTKLDFRVYTTASGDPVLMTSSSFGFVNRPYDYDGTLEIVAFGGGIAGRVRRLNKTPHGRILITSNGNFDQIVGYLQGIGLSQKEFVHARQ
ncbi:hypothetical protein [Streptomyces sp. NPDC051014]|uniref:hypothetical protein n=1 Tax=Streptomyces sp. NPDC051014 TaxID=3155751 RepID=UPI0033D1F609